MPDRAVYIVTMVPASFKFILWRSETIGGLVSRLAKEDSSCRSESIGRRPYTTAVLSLHQMTTAPAAVQFRMRYLLLHNILTTPIGWLGVGWLVGGEVRAPSCIFIKTAGFTLLFVVIAMSTRFCLAVITLAHAKLNSLDKRPPWTDSEGRRKTLTRKN